MASKQPNPRPPQYDRRVDQVGSFKSLVKEVLEPLIGKLKEHRRAGDTLYGEHYEAKLQGVTDRHVSKAAILKLFEAKKLTRSQFLAMLRDDAIAVPAAEKILDGATFKKLCRATSGEPRLMVNKLEGPPLDIEALVESVREAVFSPPPVDLARAA